jgi:hypothetical protein
MVAPSRELRVDAHMLWSPREHCSTASRLPDDAPKYTIKDDLDPDDEMPSDTDPLAAYLTYLADKNAGHGDMGFTLKDITEMRQRRGYRAK